jgi:hypothetical protein
VLKRALELFEALSQNDFRGRLKAQKAHEQWCVSSNGNNSEGDNT